MSKKTNSLAFAGLLALAAALGTACQSSSSSQNAGGAGQTAGGAQNQPLGTQNAPGNKPSPKP